MIRAKFVCESKIAEDDGGDTGQVRLRVVTDGSPENERYFNFTPFGTVELGILNPNAFAQFKEGVEYYAEFTQAS